MHWPSMESFTSCMEGTILCVLCCRNGQAADPECQHGTHNSAEMSPTDAPEGEIDSTKSTNVADRSTTRRAKPFVLYEQLQRGIVVRQPTSFQPMLACENAWISQSLLLLMTVHHPQPQASFSWNPRTLRSRLTRAVNDLSAPQEYRPNSRTVRPPDLLCSTLTDLTIITLAAAFTADSVSSSLLLSLHSAMLRGLFSFTRTSLMTLIRRQTAEL